MRESDTEAIIENERILRDEIREREEKFFRCPVCAAVAAERFTTAVADSIVAAERERCAKVAENYSNIENRGIPTHVGIAATIRSGECLSQNGSNQARCPYCGCLLGGGIDDHTEGCPWPAEQMRKMKNSVPSK